MGMFLNNPRFRFGWGGDFSTPFAPNQVPGLTAWYDASDASTIQQTGGFISQWNDKSGNNYHATQATGTNQPQYLVTGWDGTRPCVRTDGVNDFFNTPSMPGLPSGMTVFVVSKITGPNNSGRFMLKVGSYQQRINTAGNYIIARNVTGNLLVSNTPLSTNTPYYLTTRTGSVSGNEIWINGEANGSNSSSTNFASDASTLFSDNGSAFYQGDTCEIIIYYATLNDAQRLQVENYLEAKWRTNPLRIATIQNRPHGTRETSVSPANRFIVRWMHVVAGRRKSIGVLLNNWQFSNSGISANGADYVVDSLAIEIGATSYPITFSGSRSVTVPDGTALLASDLIAMEVPDGTVIAIRLQYRTLGTFIPKTSANSIPTNNGNGTQAFVYNPANTTVSPVDGTGLITTLSGTAASPRDGGVYPMVVGQPVVDSHSVMTSGDSIFDFREDDNSNGIYGRGKFQRAMTVNASDRTGGIPSINFAASGSRTNQWVLGPQYWTPYFSYVRVYCDEGGTNDINANVSANALLANSRTLWAAAKAANPAIRVMRTQLMTTTKASTDSYTTMLGQTRDARWFGSGAAPTFNGLLPADLSAGLINRICLQNANLDNTDRTYWRVDGVTPFLSTPDGVHESVTGCALGALEVRSDILLVF